MYVSFDESAWTTSTSARQDLITALLGSWMTIGGFVDGFAHRNLDTPETFFTPWHAILYSGYVASLAWFVWLTIANRPQTRNMRTAIPRGYETTAIGLAVFAAGGIGDLVWHTIFGIEASIEALLSPTHIILLVGAVLILSGPVRSRWLDQGHDPDQLVGFLPPLIAVTAVAAEVSFFFQYIDGLSTRFMQVPYVPGVETGYFELVAGLSSILMTTIILMGALLFLLRRWSLAPGSCLFLFGVFGVLMEVLEGFEFPEDLIAPLAAGLAAELLMKVLRPSQARAMATRWFAFAVPVVLWGTRFVVFTRFADIGWPVNVWSGSLVFAGLAGVGLSLLAIPPAVR